MWTVLKGKFKDGVMVETTHRKIIAERCNDGIKEIKVSVAKKNSPVFSFKRNDRIRVHNPTVMDPYEKSIVYINTTELKGDGLFARRDIEPFELVSYYSGLIWPFPVMLTSTAYNR